MITIFRLFPAELNLNGDAENANVLSKRLEWSGVEHQLVDVTSQSELEACLDEVEKAPNRCVVVIGHGSQAAIASLSTVASTIQKLYGRMVDLGTPGIVVSSGLGLVGRAAERSGDSSSRAYKLQVTLPGWPANAIGYFNSQAQDSMLSVESNVIRTYLHGPFLARNQDWATELLRRAGANLRDSVQEQSARLHLEKIWEMPDD